MTKKLAVDAHREGKLASLRGLGDAERIPLKQGSRFADEKRNSQQSLTYPSMLDSENKNYKYDSGTGSIGTANCSAMLDEPNQAKLNELVEQKLTRNTNQYENTRYNTDL